MSYNFKDTNRLIEDRSKTDSPASSSLHSSLPEMSKFEERQLQRSFQAIQRPETPPSPKEELGGHFNLTFRDTQTDFDKDHERPKEYNRQSSVDSDDDERFQRAKSSGMFNSSVTGSRESVLTLGATDSSFVPVTQRDKLGASIDMEDKLEKIVAATDKKLWDTSQEASVHVVPQYTRDRTPDATASQGNLVIGGSISSTSAFLNRNKLDATMRDHIRDAHRDQIQIEETSFSRNSGRNDEYTLSMKTGALVKKNRYYRLTNQSTKSQSSSNAFADQKEDHTDTKSPYQTNQSTENHLARTMRDFIRDRSGELPTSNSPHLATDSRDIGNIWTRNFEVDEDEKIPPCWPRCVAFGVGFAVLLAVILVLTVVFRSEQKAKVGTTIDDPIPYQECGNIKLNLSDNFTINCMFDLDHDTRDGIENSTYVTITKPDKSEYNETGLTFVKGNWSSSFENTTNCTTIGNYRLKFKEANEDFQLNITLESPTIVTNMDQHFFNNTDDLSEFRLECNVSGDCTRYELDIVGIHDSREHVLNENLTCTTYFSNTIGNRLNCTATIPASIVELYSQLRCRISSPETSTQYRVFQYPTCGKMPTCPALNCSKSSTERKQVDNCEFVQSFVSSCFYSGRKVYSFCKDAQNSCSCKMNWCQSGRRVLKNENPGQLVCGVLYEPFTFTARPTTKGTPLNVG